MQFTQEHAEIRRTLRAIIDKDINPHVDQWEEDGIFPAHEVFKKLGSAGLLGINKPTDYGGMGLDYSYAMVMAEELGQAEMDHLVVEQRLAEHLALARVVDGGVNDAIAAHQGAGAGP